MTSLVTIALKIASTTSGAARAVRARRISVGKSSSRVAPSPQRSPAGIASKTASDDPDVKRQAADPAVAFVLERRAGAKVVVCSRLNRRRAHRGLRGENSAPGNLARGRCIRWNVELCRLSSAGSEWPDGGSQRGRTRLQSTECDHEQTHEPDSHIVNVCHVYPYEVADGPANMALDEALLEAVGTGEPAAVLRTYGWSVPTLSLGYFQRLAEVRADSRCEPCRSCGGRRAGVRSGIITS